MKTSKSLPFDRQPDLQFHPLADLCLDPSVGFYQPQSLESDLSLELSLMDRGMRKPFIATESHGQLVILDGKRRYPMMLKHYGPDHVIPVLMVNIVLTQDEMALLQMDLANTRKKLKVDLVSEFHLYDKHVPKQQGVKGDEKRDRRKQIAEFMGISTSHLAMLLRIDKVNPKLLKAVDDGLATLSKVQAQAKEIERREAAVAAEKNASTEKDPDAEVVELLRFKDKHVDTSERLRCCPACNRYIAPKWEDIPELFNLERDDTNNATNWLESPKKKLTQNQ